MDIECKERAGGTGQSEGKSKRGKGREGEKGEGREEEGRGGSGIGMVRDRGEVVCASGDLLDGRDLEQERGRKRQMDTPTD